MLRVFQNLNVSTVNDIPSDKVGIATGYYNNVKYTAISYDRDGSIKTQIFNLFEWNNKDKQVFTWDTNQTNLDNTLDLSLMYYCYYNIKQPDLSTMVDRFTNESYNNNQIKVLQRSLGGKDQIPYYVWMEDLHLRSKIYLQLGKNIYQHFTQKDWQFYRHLLKAKQVLSVIRKNEVAINTDVLLEYSKNSKNKYKRICNRILKEVKLNRLKQYLDVTGTITGRVVGIGGASLQTLPKGVGLKRCFESRFPDGLIVVSDWNAMELRLALAISGEKDLTETDIHTKAAQKLFKKTNISHEEREKAKIINFSAIYGGFVHKHAADISELYPLLGIKIQEVTVLARQIKKQINVFGRKRFFNDNTLFQTKAFNNLVQGTAADICLRALYLVQEKIRLQKLESKIILAVHDSIVFDCKKNELDTILKIIQEVMTDAAIPNIYKQQILFPVLVQTGKNYEDLCDLKTIYKDEI
tara:strand:- start:12386 stop:13786 length:1401 start_codon:yes stop_codon:yes gene_type:complete